MHKLAVIATAAVLAGCAVGPDYKPPVVQVDAAFVSPSPMAANPQTPSADIVSFWHGFADPVLDDLIAQGIKANGDVRIARARLQEARATLQGARAAQLPEVDVNGQAGRALQPEYLYPGTTRGQRTGNLFIGDFTANWELDFFGRNRRAAESAAAQVDAFIAGVDAAHVSVAAEIARNYLDLRGLQRRYEVAKESLVNQQDALKITEARLDVGRGTQLDVARARSLYASTEASLPALQAAIERDAFRIATLTAQSPRAVSESLAVVKPLPSLPVTDLGALPVGTPEQLLRRRPDLIAAERQLAAATASIGVATADLFPRISFQGLIGFATTRASDFGGRNSQEYQLGVGLNWPLLDFGRVRSRIAASEARAQQSLASYEQTVATALEETDGALSGFTRSAQQADRLAEAARSAEEAQKLARIRFDAGVVDFLVVLDAERQTLSARDALVQSQVGQATSLVAVYRALGGGWNAGTP